MVNGKAHEGDGNATSYNGSLDRGRRGPSIPLDGAADIAAFDCGSTRLAGQENPVDGAAADLALPRRSVASDAFGRIGTAVA